MGGAQRERAARAAAARGRQPTTKRERGAEGPEREGRGEGRREWRRGRVGGRAVLAGSVGERVREHERVRKQE